MSDEQKPPALSLRPRKKPDEEAAASDAEAPKLSLQPKAKPAETAGADQPEKPRLSLKPKTSSEGSAPTEAPAPLRAKPKLSIKPDTSPRTETPPPAAESPADLPASAEPAEEKPRLRPKLGVPSDPGSESAEPANPPEPGSGDTHPGIDPKVKTALDKAKTEKPKLKLNLGKAADSGPAPPAQQSSGFVGTGVETVPPTPPPPPPPTGEPGSPPPVPVITEQVGNGVTAPPLPPPVGSGDDDDDETEAPARRRLRPEQRPVFKIAVIVLGVMLLGSFGAGGYLLYTLFFAAPEPVIFTPRPVQPAAETASTEPTGPVSMAGKLIEKAQEAVADHDANVTEVDAVTETAADVPPAPQVVIDSPGEDTVPTSVEPSAAFRTWASNAVISGVAETSNPRAFINGVLVKQGDTVDHGLGIVFDRIDPDRNLVIFKDASGALVGKRY